MLTLLATAALAAEGSYDLVTLNVWGLPDPIARDRAGRLPAVAEWLDAADADVAGLQELWRGARGMLPVPTLLQPRREDADSGLAIVSGRVVRDLRASWFAAERGVDAFKAKGMLEAVVELDGNDVYVLVTHLQAGAGDRNARIRSLQVEELLGRVAEHRGPSVVMGDFNLYAANPVDRATERALGAAGLVDAAAAAGDLSPTYPGTTDRYDRILLRDDASARWIVDHADVVQWSDAPLSDHYAVAAKVRLHTP